MSSIFPILQPITSSTATESALPLKCEPKWDFKEDKPVFAGGEPVMVTGLEATMVWAFNALKTDRRQWPCLSPNYGNDSSVVIGSSFSEELKKAEISRYVAECLTASPYITAATVEMVDFSGEEISVTVALSTIYGEVRLSV